MLQVGHALENDLAALRVLHSRCIDTAALYPHPKVCSVAAATSAPHGNLLLLYVSVLLWLQTWSTILDVTQGLNVRMSIL